MENCSKHHSSAKKYVTAQKGGKKQQQQMCENLVSCENREIFFLGLWGWFVWVVRCGGNQNQLCSNNLAQKREREENMNEKQTGLSSMIISLK